MNYLGDVHPRNYPLAMPSAVNNDFTQPTCALSEVERQNPQGANSSEKSPDNCGLTCEAVVPRMNSSNLGDFPGY